MNNSMIINFICLAEIIIEKLKTNVKKIFILIFYENSSSRI
jgi:hypothetical protein